MKELRARFSSASLGTVVGSSLSILSFIILAKNVGAEKIGVLGLHLVVSGLLLNLVSCRAELIIPRLSRDRAAKFVQQIVTIAVIASPLMIALNFFVYEFILDVKGFRFLPLMTALHTVGFVVFLAFNAYNVNVGDYRKVLISYSLQGTIYLAFVLIISFFGVNKLEPYILAHTSSFVAYPAITFLLAKNFTRLKDERFLSISELLQERKVVFPLMVQGLVNSSSIALLYFGVNLSGGQSAVGIFTIAHKLLSFPLRAIGLPSRQVFILAFSRNLIKQKTMILTATGVIITIIISKVILLGADVSLFLGSPNAEIASSVEDLYLWWFGALIALPAIGAAVAAGESKKYSIFEIAVLVSRALGLVAILLSPISVTFFLEATSLIYFVLAASFLTWTIVSMEKT